MRPGAHEECASLPGQIQSGLRSLNPDNLQDLMGLPCRMIHLS